MDPSISESPEFQQSLHESWFELCKWIFLTTTEEDFDFFTQFIVPQQGPKYVSLTDDLLNLIEVYRNFIANPLLLPYTLKISPLCYTYIVSRLYCLGMLHPREASFPSLYW